MKTAQQAKVELKLRGHSYRSASRHIGRSYQWISDVLNGHKASRPVIEAVFNLPERQRPTRKTNKTHN